MKAARALGIPVAAGIMSWDHLSSKALLHIAPGLDDRLERGAAQEAVEMHGLPAERVVVTGAQCYDQWFDAAARARSARTFCRARRPRPGRPFVLCVCSALSPTPEPPEPVLVKRWIEALRASADPAAARRRRAGAAASRAGERVGRHQPRRPRERRLPRPQPDRRRCARTTTSIRSIYSERGRRPVTSAFLEAAIVGRPVLTFMLPEYRMHQEEMVHFRYLLTVEGGLLHTAPDCRAHLAQLADALAVRGARDERNRRFLAAFVRPRGLDVPATPAFVDAVERLAAAGRRRPDQVLTRRSPANTLVSLVAASANAGVGRWLLMDTFDIEHAAFERDRATSKQGILGARDQQREQERIARDERLKAKEAQRREKASRRSGQQRAKDWQKWRRALSPSRQLARIKGGVKQIFLPRRGRL